MQTAEQQAGTTELCRELAELISHALNLERAPCEWDPGLPLYGGELGFDSIDILEIALIVSKQYGIHLKAESEENEQIFRSLQALAQYVAAHRTK